MRNFVSIVKPIRIYQALNFYRFGYRNLQNNKRAKMEYTILINQSKALQWKLNFAEASLCSFYSQDHNWVKTRITQADGDYYCIAIAKLIKELPLVGKTKSQFSKLLNSLHTKKIFDKQVDEDNSRIVYYRMNPKHKKEWLEYYKNTIVFPNENTINIKKQVFPNENEVFPNENEVFPNENLSNNHISNYHNQSTNNHIPKEDDESFSNILDTEFERIVSIYPQTTNNTLKALAKAKGSFLKLSASKRAELFKAVKNYSKTKQVKDHLNSGTTNFIKSLTTFITKGEYRDFIYGLPEEYEYAIEFDDKKFPNGGENSNEPQRITTFGANGIVDITDLVKNIELAKADYKANGGQIEMNKYFSDIEIRAINEQMGGSVVLEGSEAFHIADAIVDFKEAM